MKKVILLSFIFLFTFIHQLSAQMWQTVGGGMNYEVRDLYEDTIANKLYVVGGFAYAGDSIVNQIATWDGNTWNNVGHGTGDTSCVYACDPLLSVIRYQNNIYAGGYVRMMGGNQSIKNLAKWDGVSWSGLGNPNWDVRLFVANDSLFVTNHFDTINNQHVESIAKWNGTSFEAFGTPLPFKSQSGTVSSCTYYHNQYYFSGNFSFPGGKKEIIRWDGSQWLPLGNGILGNNAWAGLTVEYKNLLYVAGFFSQNDGNTGNNIMTWDGTTWRDAFPGVDFSSFGIRYLKVYKNKLYISAIFTMAGYPGYHYIGVYDGTNFCAFGGSEITQQEGMPIALAGFRDTIYIANNRTFFGDSIKFIGKWMGGDSVDACLTIIQNVNEPSANNANIKISPNPATNQFTIENSQLRMNAIHIYNVLGSVVYQQLTTSNQQLSIDVSSWKAGVYFVEVETEKGVIRKKLVKE